jgi:hypothetical protein
MVIGSLCVGRDRKVPICCTASGNDRDVDETARQTCTAVSSRPALTSERHRATLAPDRRGPGNNIGGQAPPCRQMAQAQRTQLHSPHCVPRTSGGRSPLRHRSSRRAVRTHNRANSWKRRFPCCCSLARVPPVYRKYTAQPPLPSSTRARTLRWEARPFRVHRNVPKHMGEPTNRHRDGAPTTRAYHNLCPSEEKD